MIQSRESKRPSVRAIKSSVIAALRFLRDNPQLLQVKAGSFESLLFDTLKQFLGEISDDLLVLHHPKKVKEWVRRYRTSKLSPEDMLQLTLIFEPNGSQGSPDFWVCWNGRHISINAKSTKTGIVKWNSGLPSEQDICVFARTQEDGSGPQAVTYTMGKNVYTEAEMSRMRESRHDVRESTDKVEIIHRVNGIKVGKSYEHPRSDRMDTRNWLVPPLSDTNPLREKEVENYITNFSFGLSTNEDVKVRLGVSPSKVLA